MSSGYGFRVIRNVSIDFGRKALRRRTRREEASRESDVHHRRPERPNQCAARDECIQRMREAVCRLPDEHRDVILLTEFHDKTQVEAAAELGMSERNLRDLRKEGLAMLKKLLGGAPETDAGGDQGVRRRGGSSLRGVAFRLFGCHRGGRILPVSCG